MKFITTAQISEVIIHFPKSAANDSEISSARTLAQTDTAEWMAGLVIDEPN